MKTNKYGVHIIQIEHNQSNKNSSKINKYSRIKSKRVTQTTIVKKIYNKIKIKNIKRYNNIDKWTGVTYFFFRARRFSV